ncbi:hypothetical protein AOLI_G00252620 [Acnodon oligacanthus]
MSPFEILFGRPANIGWSLFLGGGATVALNKINGLAYQLRMLANHTEAALGLVNSEMRAVRTAVLQNRMALDLVLAEKGGVCKLLGASCCFFMPDYHDNITGFIKHMKDTARGGPLVARGAHFVVGTMCYELPDNGGHRNCDAKNGSADSATVKAEIEDYNPYDDQTDLYLLPDWMKESDEHS